MSVDQPQTTTEDVLGDESTYDDDALWQAFQAEQDQRFANTSDDPVGGADDPELEFMFTDPDTVDELDGDNGQYNESEGTAERANADTVDSNSSAGIVTEFGSMSAGEVTGDIGGVPSAVPFEKAMPNLLNPVDGYPVRTYGRDAITQHKIRGQKEELERYTRNWVHKEGDRNYRVSINGDKKQPEEHRKELCEVFGDKQASWRMTQQYVRQKVEAFVEDHLADEFGGMEKLAKTLTNMADQFESPAVTLDAIKTRTAAFLMDPIDLPDQSDGSERKTTWDIPLGFGSKCRPEKYSGGFFDTPEEYVGEMSPALRPSEDALGAGTAAIEEFENEFPSVLESIDEPDYQSSASVIGRVIDVFDPFPGNSKQVVRIRDRNNDIAKVTVWNRSDHERHGMDTLGTGVNDWSDGLDVPRINQGDLIEIRHASPSIYNSPRHGEQLNIAVTQESMVIIREKGDGDSHANLCLSSGFGRMQHFGLDDRSKYGVAGVDRDIYAKSDPSEFDDGEAVPLPRLRTRNVTLARLDEFMDSNKLGLGNMAFHSEVAYDGSFNGDQAENADGTPEIRRYDGPMVFAKHEDSDVELPINAAELEVDDTTPIAKQDDLALDRLERMPSIFRDDDDEVHVGHECPECESKNTESKQLQKGGADEGMTGIHVCNDCDNRWTTGY